MCGVFQVARGYCRFLKSKIECCLYRIDPKGNHKFEIAQSNDEFEYRRGDAFVTDYASASELHH